jgi:hypothetical protein
LGSEVKEKGERDGEKPTTIPAPRYKPPNSIRNSKSGRNLNRHHHQFQPPSDKTLPQRKIQKIR